MDSYSKAFELLNDTLILGRVFINDDESDKIQQVYKNYLKPGENFDKVGKTFFVEKLMNPFYGVCYVLTPDENYQMKRQEYFFISSEAESKEKLPPFEVYLIHPEDRYGYLLPGLGTV